MHAFDPEFSDVEFHPAFVFIVLPPSFCQRDWQNDGGRTMEERRRYDLASDCIVSTVRDSSSTSG